MSTTPEVVSEAPVAVHKTHLLIPNLLSQDLAHLIDPDVYWSWKPSEYFLISPVGVVRVANEEKTTSWVVPSAEWRLWCVISLSPAAWTGIVWRQSSPTACIASSSLPLPLLMKFPGLLPSMAFGEEAVTSPVMVFKGHFTRSLDPAPFSPWQPGVLLLGEFLTLGFVLWVLGLQRLSLQFSRCLPLFLI